MFLNCGEGSTWQAPRQELMQMEMNISGVEQLIKNMDDMPGLVAQEIYGDGMRAAAAVVARRARILVREKSGRLKRSIRPRRRSVTVDTLYGSMKVSGGGAQVVAGGRGARQAWIIEHGRRGAMAFPYLEPALLGTPAKQLIAAGNTMSASFIKLGRAFAAGNISRQTSRLLTS